MFRGKRYETFFNFVSILGNATIGVGKERAGPHLTGMLDENKSCCKFL